MDKPIVWLDSTPWLAGHILRLKCTLIGLRLCGPSRLTSLPAHSSLGTEAVVFESYLQTNL